MITKEERESIFLKKAKEVHGDKYSYENMNYVRSVKPIDITCPKHGIFKQRPGDHLRGQGCRKCGYEKGHKILTIDSIIARAKVIHNNKFDYSLFTEYQDYHKQKIPIICPDHGLFYQGIGKHLGGQNGCKGCLQHINPYSKTEWIKIAKDRLATFYVLKCYNEEETFYKIGLTLRTVKLRYKTKKLMPYKYEIVKEVMGPPEDIWELEKQTMRDLKEYKYSPKISFDGSFSECFSRYEVE